MALRAFMDALRRSKAPARTATLSFSVTEKRRGCYQDKKIVEKGIQKWEWGRTGTVVKGRVHDGGVVEVVRSRRALKEVKKLRKRRIKSGRGRAEDAVEAASRGERCVCCFHVVTGETGA